MNPRILILLTFVCLIATALALYGMSGIQPDQLQAGLQQAGIWAPIFYILIYVVATLLILPSTALNLTGGALFGPWWGTFWTSIAAVVAAIAAFTFTRTIGRDLVADRFAGRWQTMDAEIRQGGLFYMFAIRLLPIIPYGLVNFAAGMTSIRFRDYLIGTLLGTVPGVLPFVMIGSSGLKAFQTGDMLPLLGALTLTGMLVGGATWYRRRRRDRSKDLEQHR
jgi:uncharacterized membrane protein YdjX (TVP38/TMEM64 family)